jgi:hypothetical protein
VEIPHQNHNYGAAAATVNPDVWSFMSQYALHFRSFQDDNVLLRQRQRHTRSGCCNRAQFRRSLTSTLFLF